MDDERSEKRSSLAMVLAALLSSLIGGVCSRMMFGGRTGEVAVTVLLLLAGIWILDRNFMLLRVEAAPKLADLSVGLSQGARREDGKQLLPEGRQLG